MVLLLLAVAARGLADVAGLHVMYVSVAGRQRLSDVPPAVPAQHAANATHVHRHRPTRGLRRGARCHPRQNNS